MENRTELDSAPGQSSLVDEPGVAHALRVTIVYVFVCCLAVAAFTVFLGWVLVPSLCLGAAVTSLAALILARSGRTRAGILLTLGGPAYVVMHAAALKDGIQSIGMTIVPMLIIVASLLLDRLKLALFTAAALAGTAGMLAVRYYVLRLEQYNSGDLGDYFVFVVACMMAAAFGSLLSRQIRRAFDMLAASQRRYRRIFENIQDVYCELGAEGTFLELSPAASSLFGEPIEEIVGRSLARYCVKREDFDVFAATLRRHGRVLNYELLLRDKRGALMNVLVNATLQGDRDAGEERMIGSIRDITLRRRAEDALRESEARLRIALEASGAGTFDYYPETKQLICSAISKGHLGLRSETDLDRDKSLSSVHPDDRECLILAGVSAAAPGGNGEFAVEFRSIGIDDGRERWIAARGRMFFNGEGGPVRLIGTTLDISERKELEEKLRRRVEELQTIMDVAPVALFTAHDPECREVTVNRMANAMMETPEGSYSRSSPGGPISPRQYLRNGVEVPSHQLPLQTAARGLEVRNAELEVVLPSGKRRVLWGHAVPLFDAAGRVRGAIAAAQDVTAARQRAEDRLRESEQRFQNTADAAPVLIWFGDPQGHLTFVNEQFARFAGVSAQELLGHGWRQIIHPDDLDSARAVFAEGAGSRTAHQLEYRARRADGAWRWLLGTTELRQVGTEYAGQVGSAIDITDLKRREEENLVRQKLESVGMLASGIAHDFNNLLGSVLAQAELAQSLLAAGESPAEELKRIGDVSRRGSEIVRQLMLYAGRESETLAQADVSRIVTEMLDLLSLSISKQATLEADLAPDLPAAQADAAQIRQVVMNLVTNASEAILGGVGQVRVSTRKETVARGRRDAKGHPLAEGDYVRLEVSDTGQGMNREMQARIFDPFFTTKSAGRGLGLAVVQGIVCTLDGSIEVASEMGRGSTFVVLLPCVKHNPEPALRPLARLDAAAPQEAAGAILIVEDEELLRQPLAKMLRRRGFTVTEAADGNAALETIRAMSAPVDVVLLDITLPGASSGAVFEEARRLLPNVRVIATTAYCEDTATATLRNKPDYFIRKPYRIGVLLELVQRAMASRPDA
jgi:PAS domain S-box-containing protein